jgi:antitoxin HigA-1
MKKTLHPVHPGEVLSEEFLKPMNLSQNRVALSVGVPARRINEIVLEKRGISADTALRLGRFFWDITRILVGFTGAVWSRCNRRGFGERLELEVRTYAVNK